MPTVPIASLIRELTESDRYPDRPARIEVTQTHASVVFLTDQYAYKLKKPVNLGFLDYSTLRRRHRMCRRELNLNRRLAPSVYLSVVPVTYRRGRLAVETPGRIVDYLVKMRRLAETDQLRSHVVNDSLTAHQIDAIAERIARFHDGSATGRMIARFGRTSVIAANVEENFDQTARFVGDLLAPETFDAIRDYSRRFLPEASTLLDRRRQQGRIRDGHGDLRCDHVYLEPGPDAIQIVDCIEFNDRYRFADVAADLAFLVMDLSALGAPDHAASFIERYVEHSRQEAGDHLADLLDFYVVYRAYVRAKVSALRSIEPEVPAGDQAAARLEARRFFLLARTTVQGDRRPWLLATCGLTGAGKSVLADQLGSLLGARVVTADVVRKELAGIPLHQHAIESIDSGLYHPEMNQRVYTTLLDRAEPLLRRGRSVILDATYRRRSDRQAVAALAKRLGARLLFMECRVAEPIARERLFRRLQDPGTASDGRLEIYDQQQREFEAITELSGSSHLVVDTALPIETQVAAVFDRLEAGGRNRLS